MSEAPSTDSPALAAIKQIEAQAALLGIDLSKVNGVRPVAGDPEFASLVRPDAPGLEAGESGPDKSRARTEHAARSKVARDSWPQQALDTVANRQRQLNSIAGTVADAAVDYTKAGYSTAADMAAGAYEGAVESTAAHMEDRCGGAPQPARCRWSGTL